MYETGVIPNDFNVNKTVTIPKKVRADKCENYRTISLTIHASKILTTIIYRRIEQTIESSLDEDQFVFGKESGTLVEENNLTRLIRLTPFQKHH